ncbi:conserved Plasmodium protein, unknown function [Plasmodium gallinaceum]|uniref:Uncharacterized protein n=1 Tax=Plasmodium gallinaceum TaxID=5849 RepID=A0A1J1GTE6_PLAGA|nr:conserved Plasmodium protein, unknown function [Plasmodium gallinaceum]CRG94574.1 conserved Plasmodium protein, unknown function [Plasmodium gallinaceum]
MERKIKSKKKVSSSQKNKIINVDDRLNNQFIKTSEPKISKETLYFDKNMNNSIINKIKLPTKDLEKEMKEKTKEEIKRYICVEENKSNIKNIDHLNNPIGENIKKEKENKNILNKTKKYNLIDTQTGNIEYNSTSYAEENIDDLIHNIDDKDNFFSFSNNHKLINIKSREIFKRNMPITDENFNCEDTHFIGQNEKKCNLEEFNKSLQFLEDIEEFKKKKKKMDDAVLNIGKSNEKNSKEINEKKKEKLCLIEEKETSSYKLKKKKKIEKYNISCEEKEKYMKNYMLKLEEQYKQKKEDDLQKEISENKEELKKFQDRQNTFLNFLKNPRLNLPKNEDLNDYLSVYPETIHFTDITKGMRLTKDLLITNKSKILLHVIIIPPLTKYFFVKEIINIYNKSEENSKINLNNQIAPGHTLKIKICYNVFTLNQQNDHIKLLTEAGNKIINLKVFQSIPNIKFDKVLNFGPIRPNEKKKKLFPIRNNGKETNILILPKKLYNLFETKKNIEKEENILNLLIKKSEEKNEIMKINENEDIYYIYNNVKSYSYNFLFLYKKLVNNFDDIYFENILQDFYYFNLKNSEEKTINFFFKSNKIGIYEKDYFIITDIECNFDELEDKKEYDFINYNKLNIFQFSVKTIVEPLLLNLLYMNRKIEKDTYKKNLLEYIQNNKKDNLDYFFYINSLNSFKFSDIQICSGYNWLEIEVLNSGLIDLEISCNIYIKENEGIQSKPFILDIQNKGNYYYDELFDDTLTHSLYEESSKDPYIIKEKNKKGKKKKKNGKLCPIYIYPKRFNLSYKKSQKIFIVFKPLEKHKNFKNYYFILAVKNLTKGSDINMEDLLELHKNNQESDGIPLVCINEKKIIKNKKLHERYSVNISKYENTSSSSSITKCSRSSNSELSEENIMKKQNMKKSYFYKKNKKLKYIALYVNLYANIIKPSIYVNVKNLSRCFFPNPLYLYKTSFTIKNQNDFYINYFFENLNNLKDISTNKYILKNDIINNLNKKIEKKELEHKKEKEVLCKHENIEENKYKNKDEKKYKDKNDKEKIYEDKSVNNSYDDEKDFIYYYDYFDILNILKLRKEEKIKKKKEKKNESKTRNSSTLTNNKRGNSKKNETVKQTNSIINIKKRNLNEEKNQIEENFNVKNVPYYNLNKKLIKYFYQRGNSDNVGVYVLIQNSINKNSNENGLKNEKTKDSKKKKKNILKIEKGDYCLKPHEKKKIVLFFLVNKYGYYEININMIFYMDNYKISKSIKANILARCKGLNISKETLFFKNSYSHYCFCDVVKISNLDKDLKLINLDSSDITYYGFISLYNFYLFAFKKKKKKKKIQYTDIFHNFMKNFYEIIEKDMDHNYIKKENKFYNCNKCKCFFKYNSCLDYLKNFFTNYNNITNYLFHFNNKEYLIQILSEINNENKEKLDLIKFNNNFKDIYNYHQNENIYLHNNKIGHNKYFIIYPSNLLLFPLKETFFFFFFFFSHAESVNISLSVKWCKFNKDIFIEGESKNSNIKITHNKNLNVKNVDNKKEQKERNYIGICSGLFYFNVENLNDLEISYEFCEMDNSEFEYNYFKKKYIMIFNCNVKLDCYYKDFYSFIKINNIKYIKSECNLKKNSLNYQNSEPNLSEVSKEDNKIHGCIIMNGSNLNHIGGKDIKRHEYRLLLFYDDNITKDKNFLNLRFSIKLKHFYNNEIIKVSSYFYIHTFDFLLINENNLLLSIFYYLKKKLLIEEKKNSLEEYNNKSKTAEYDNKKQMNSFVDEMLEELNFIKKEEFNEEKKDNNTTNILNEDFKKIKNYFDIEEYVLLEFQNFIYKMENESKKKMQIKEQCEENSLRYHFSEKKEYIFKNVQNEKQKINYYEEFINQNKFYQKDYNKDKIINDNIINFIWKYILLKKLNNKIGYDFIDFIRKHKYELYYSYEKKDIIRENECMKKEKKEKISKQKVLTNLCKNYCYELNRENDIIYIIITNTNKYNLKLNFDSNHYINDTINKIFHYCINDLILKKEWNGISEFINEYKLNKNKKKKYKNINIKTLNSQSYNKLKHLNFIYKERNKDYYYKYLDQILKEKNDYCLNLKNNFFLDFFIFKNKINSMKSSFVKLSLYCDNINFYEDEITMNLNKSEKICKIFITSKIKSLHLLNPYKITKDEDKCIFLNCLYVDYEILKNYEEVNKVEKNEKIEQICKCFDEILKPYEIIIFNSCNLKKNITWSFSKIFYKNKKNTELKYEGETTKTNQEKTQKTENNVNENINEKEINEENNIHTEKFLNSSNNINFRNEDCELKIDSMNSCINTKEKKKIKIFLENILHKEGNHLYKIKCNYEYIDDNSLNNRIKNDVSNYTINEDLKKLLFLDFYLYINIEKPQIMLLYNNQVYYDKKIKFDFNYFNKKAYKKINKMYKSQIINDIIYEDMNEINKYFDIIFLKNKNLKLYFINQQDIHFFTYIYTKKFFVIKNIYIDNEEFDHSNTHIFNIKRKCNVCIELEIDELKFKNEIKNNMNNSSTLKNNISKKLIYEDFLIFQYLTSKNQQKFLIECHYNVSFIILKENKYIFHEFNNLKRKDQGINSKELNDIENNLLDNIKKGKIIYNEIEVKNNIYFIYIHFTELKIYKFCLFLFNTTKIPATWNIKENSSNLISSSLKNINSKIFHFSKTKGILFGETYDIHSVNSNKYEKKKNPFLFPDYLIVTFEPISKSDITKKYCINIADGEKIYFYLKAIYQQKND